MIDDSQGAGCWVADAIARGRHQAAERALCNLLGVETAFRQHAIDHALSPAASHALRAKTYSLQVPTWGTAASLVSGRIAVLVIAGWCLGSNVMQVVLLFFPQLRAAWL